MADFFIKRIKNFNYYSRGSAFECTSCLRKALKRKLITEEDNTSLRMLFEKYLKLMNGYIKSIGTENSNEIHEEAEAYLTEMNFDLDNLLTNDLMTE